MPINLCIWMNIPSHHQWDFFTELYNHPEINLSVRYYDNISKERKDLGWSMEYQLRAFEQYVRDDERALESVPDWQSAIHIVPGFSSSFLQRLLPKLIKKGVPWIHWSERSGRQFAELLNYNYQLIKLFYPVFLRYKGYYAFARLVNNHALGAFAQGDLAETDFIRWGIKKNKIAHLYYSIPPVKTGQPASKSPPQQNTRTFCYTGTLSKRKGTDILLKAFSLLKGAEKWKLVLVGPFPEQQNYQKLAQQLQISHRVSFTGAVPAEQIGKYLNECDVFVMPTRFDGWGVVLNEAASLAKPLISTEQCGAAYHLIKPNENGFKIRAGSISSLKESMQYYIDHPHQIQHHGEKSLKLFQNYTPEKNAQRLVSAIKRWQNAEQPK